MVRERTPARAPDRPYEKANLGDSWGVVESDGDDEYTAPHAATPRRRSDDTRRHKKVIDADTIPRRRPKANTRASAEPELIMPMVYEGGISNSWISEDAGSRRPQTRQTRLRRSSPEKTPSFTRKRAEQTAHMTVESAADDVVSFIQPIFRYIYEVLGRAFQRMITPLSFIVAVWLLLGVSMFLRNLFFSSLRSALSPICRVPGTQFLNLPICQPTALAQYSGEDPPPVQFDQLMNVQNKFEAVMEEAAGGVSLPLDMKRGETSIRDLRQVVRFSQLHSRNELVLEFDMFLETARIASYDLQKFNSHVGRGVDNILSTARWTKRVLDGIAERDASQGAIGSFFKDTVFAPFQPVKFTESLLLDQYIQHTRVVEEEINRLVTEAQALLLVLQNLEDRLDVIHGISVRDNLHVQGSKTDVLSELWTMVGGNRGKLGKYESQLKLLNQVNSYRQNAIAHVSGTMLKLQAMGTELEELRERVGGVDLLGGKGAVPLSVHIDNIEMGVERLEKRRRGAKEIENEELKRSLDRGKDPNRARMIEGS